MSGKQGFPGPLNAFLIGSCSVAAVFFWWVLGARFFDQVLCLALAMAAGRGLVAWLAAGQVEEPRREKLGLVRFDLRTLPGLLLLTPAAFLVLELQNAFCSLMGYLPLRGALEAPPVVLGLDKPGWPQGSTARRGLRGRLSRGDRGLRLRPRPGGLPGRVALAVDVRLASSQDRVAVAGRAREEPVVPGPHRAVRAGSEVHGGGPDE
jgi:hypothetical protein